MTTLSSQIQKLRQTSPWVELYTIDATNIGGTTYHVTNFSNLSGGGTEYQGIVYQAFPIATDGWAHSTTGQSARPKVYVSNVLGTSGPFLQAVLDLGDLVGATFTRVRTYEMYLDNGIDPQPTQCFVDERIIHQMEYQDQLIITWVLAHEADRDNMLPKRQCLRDVTITHLHCPGVARTRTRA